MDGACVWEDARVVVETRWFIAEGLSIEEEEECW